MVDIQGMQGLMGYSKIKDGGEDTWVTCAMSVEINILFTGLQKGATVYMQVCFKSADGYADWSDIKEWVVR